MVWRIGVLWRRKIVQVAFPRRHVTDQKMFERLHRYLCEVESFGSDMHDTRHDRSVQTEEIVDDVPKRVEDRPNMSKRKISHVVNVLLSTVEEYYGTNDCTRTMHRKCKPWFIQIMLHMSSLHWFIQQLAAQPDFSGPTPCYLQMNVPLLMNVFLLRTTWCVGIWQSSRQTSSYI